MNKFKKTPLHGWHVENGAKMGPFGEWEMPLWYSGANKEYRAVREKAGLFDVSHMKVIDVEGKDAEKFVRYVATNDISRLDAGDIQYTLLCDQNGGLLDDVTVYKASDTNFFFVVNAGNAEKIFVWFQTWQTVKAFEVSIDMQKDNAILALQGACAEKILSKTFPLRRPPEKRYSFRLLAKMGIFISRTGYTGEDGFEIICPQILAKTIWKTLLDIGKEEGLLPCGLVARDMLRTEAGMRLYGNDIDETANPIEAGLEKYVSFEKDFIGKSAVEKALALKHRGGGRNFQGFTMDTKFFPEHGCLIFAGAEVGIPDEFGIVTSATYSPSLKKRILLGYTREKMNYGETVWVKIGEDYRPAIVSALPFYSRKKKA
jgi:aminomethyltransferase